MSNLKTFDSFIVTVTTIIHSGLLFIFFSLYKNDLLKNKNSVIGYKDLRSIAQQLYCEPSVKHTIIVEITYKIQTSYKTLSSESATTWWLKRRPNNDKLL